MKTREWLLLIFLSVLWGGSFFLIKVALLDLPPLTIVLSRVSLAAIVLTAFVYLRGQKLPTSPRLWRSFFVMGALNTLIPFSLIVWGETQISSSLASVLNATTPVFTVLLAHLLTREESLTFNRTIGVIFSFCGVIVLVGSDVLQGMKSQSLGQIAVMGATFCYGCASIYGRRFREIPAVVTAAGMLCATTVMLLPLTFMLETPWTLNPTAATWGALFALGFVNTAIAYLVYFHLLAVAGAINTSLVTFLIPISALFLGVFILHEPLHRNTFAGMILIFLGLAAIDGRLFKTS